MCLFFFSEINGTSLNLLNLQPVLKAFSKDIWAFATDLGKLYSGSNRIVKKRRGVGIETSCQFQKR